MAEMKPSTIGPDEQVGAMKNADDWVRDAMQHLESCWHTHYRSEMVDELEAAVVAFDKALAIQPDHFDAWNEKGLALMRLERYREAAAAFAEAQRLRPEIIELQRQREESLRRLARQERALPPTERPKASSEPDPPARSRSERKLRCPMCRSDRVVHGSAPELYELKCESCGHSEIFDVMSPGRESDRHWSE
jgi:tetratricopeptide (TPR) repeat protein